MRALLFRFVAVALGVLVALVVASEVSWRLGRHLRADELVLSRQARFEDGDALKILFLGDSYTAGELSESGQGYASWLPETLSGRALQTRSIALAGTPSAVHRAQLAAWLEESGQRPQFAMLISGANNLNSLDLRQGFLADPENEAPDGMRSLYRSRRALTGLARMVGRGLRLDGPAADALPTGDPTWLAWLPWQAHVQQHTHAELLAFAALARHHGVEPLFGTYHVDDQNPAIVRAAREAGVPLFDISAFPKPTMEHLSEDGWHRNDAGNRWLAEQFAGWFEAHVTF